jgi:hypothetical protein
MAYSSITKPSDYFNTKLYDGTGSEQSITGVGFQPDFTWVKHRQDARSHGLVDAVRGATKYLISNANNAEGTDTEGLKSFDSDGFTLGTDQNIFNESGGTPKHVSWNWLGANGTASNSNGSITSTVSANTTAGFSIVSWTGSGADATIGHGLSSAPTIYIVKNRSDASDWRIGQVLTSSNNMTNGNGYYMELNDTKASTNPGNADTWGATPTAPTSSVFTVGSNNAHNGSSDNMIAYCFHSVKGYSKFGSYTGNGNADGAFVYTGFKPAWVMIKRTDSTSSWHMADSVRDPDNPHDHALTANTNNVESTSATWFDILSNGFKLRYTGAYNQSGGSYIYMAFAEEPLVANVGQSIPATAR